MWRGGEYSKDHSLVFNFTGIPITLLGGNIEEHLGEGEIKCKENLPKQLR